MTSEKPPAKRSFLHDIIDADLESGRHQTVVTRFPPEPNGYLHIGHAKAISVDFGLAKQYGGRCHLRMDDTNPTSEDQEFVRAIQDDIRWLGFDWGEHLYFASDYFERLYQFAIQLIESGKAYVDTSSEEEIREMRGSLGVAGVASEGRTRSVADNLDLFRRMRAGEFDDGAMVLRAKIDLGASNMKMRDPLLYRIRRDAHHYRTGSEWPIYPMYDFAHCLSDAIEGITHSICTLEFENNRELYDWILDTLATPARPHQYEFARLGLDYTVMSKRKLKLLVEEGHVSAWDDPRMPTLAGLRRRGFPPEAIIAFCEEGGVAKANSTADVGKLEHQVRSDLNYRSPRVMAVLRPLAITISNLESDHREDLEVPLFPADVGKPGSRTISFSRDVLIERKDFSKNPPKGFKRLSPGKCVRLRHACVIRCDEVLEKDGEVTELRCTRVDENELARGDLQGVIHWVDARTAERAEVRLYDRLFRSPKPDAAEDFRSELNPSSLEIIHDAAIPRDIVGDDNNARYQFERLGYFWRDQESSSTKLVFNRIISLRDSWSSKHSTDTPEKSSEQSKSPAKSDRRPEKRSRAQWRQEARRRDPELAARYERYRSELELGDKQADLLTGDRELADFFESALSQSKHPSEVSKWVVNDVVRELKDRSLDELPFDSSAIAALADMTANKTISAAVAKDVFAQLASTGGDPVELAKAVAAEAVGAEDLGPFIDEVVAANTDKVTAYREGKTGLLGFFIGQVMKRTGGKADPQGVREALLARLSQ